MQQFKGRNQTLKPRRVLSGVTLTCFLCNRFADYLRRLMTEYERDARNRHGLVGIVHGKVIRMTVTHSSRSSYLAHALRCNSGQVMAEEEGEQIVLLFHID